MWRKRSERRKCFIMCFLATRQPITGNSTRPRRKLPRRPWPLQKSISLKMSTKTSSRTIVNDFCANLLRTAIACPRISKGSSTSLMTSIAFLWTARRHWSDNAMIRENLDSSGPSSGCIFWGSYPRSHPQGHCAGNWIASEEDEIGQDNWVWVVEL